MATQYTPSGAVANSTYATPVVKQVNLDSDTFIMERDYRDAIITDWEDDDFLSFLEFPGDGRLGVASTFYHYEKPLLIRAVTPNAIIGTGTAASVVFTLNAASYTASGDGDRSPLKKDDIVHLPGDIYGRVDLKSGTGTATQYTISRRAGTTDDVNAAIQSAITNGYSITIPTNAHGEGTDFPDEGDFTTPTRFVGQYQTIKSYQAITGDASAHQRSVTENGTKYVWDTMLVDQLKRHRIKQKMAFMFSPEGNFTEAGLPVPLTASLRNTARTFGNRLLYDANTGFTLADLDLLINQIKTVTGVKVVNMFVGPTLRGQIENLLLTLAGGGGAIRYNDWGGSENGKKKMISLGFDGFVRHNVEFRFQEFRLLTALTGQPWQTFDREAYVVPADMSTMTYQDRNGVQTLSLNSVELMYKQQSNGISRRFREVGRDMAVTFTDKIEKGIMTQEGLRFSRRRLMFFIGPQ